MRLHTSDLCTMEILALPSKYFCILILSSFCLSNFTQAYSLCLEDQKHLLLELKNEFISGSSLSSRLAMWNQSKDNCCSWGGVECDGEGHVIGLQLDYESVRGEISDSSILFNFSHLEKLNLAYNDFGGCEIPSAIQNLVHLTHLDLSYANFSGQVPFGLSLMSSLVSLDLSSTSIVLKIENPTLEMILKNLTKLRELHLDGVDISAQGVAWGYTISSFLTELRILSLRNCSLSGPLRPSVLELHYLTYLDLSFNMLTGPLSSFHSLTYVDLSFNHLTGSLSSAGFENNTDLVYLNLGHNSLSRRIPKSLFGVPSLEVLTLSNNEFTGALYGLSSYCSYSNLKRLDLSVNKLEGPIPVSLFKLKRLQYLSLSYNSFSGSVNFGNSASLLLELDISYNNLSIDASSINSSVPAIARLSNLSLASSNLHKFPDLRNHSYLTYLNLSNNQITGEVPSWIWEIGKGRMGSLDLSLNALVELQRPYNFPSSLDYLSLKSNQLQGHLPSIPSKARFVDYSNNYFVGSLPLDVGNFTQYSEFLSFANNSLTGTIPVSLCNATNLQVLDLSRNKLSKDIPSCLVENLRDLKELNLGRNNITGYIPNTFSDNCNLYGLILWQNKLQGSIPPSLANCKSIEVLDVGRNEIKDSFPCMITSRLSVLVLHSNKFHGEVRCEKSWPNLRIIDIACNSFSGYLDPMNFTSWTGMMQDFGFRSYMVSIAPKAEREFLYYISGFTIMDFSRNNFKGGIPDAVGDMSFLRGLNLSHNGLTGTIPNSLAKLTELEELDLSHNQLYGEIPIELAALEYLSSLNLSYNKLVGPIPTILKKGRRGSQFLTFNNSSYLGNTGLCGEPLVRVCSKPEVNNGASTHEKKEIEWGGYVSAAIGFGVGFGSMVFLLLGCESIRPTFTKKADQIVEHIFLKQQDRKRRQRRRKRAQRNQVRRQ